MSKFALGALAVVLLVAVGYVLFFRNGSPIIENKNETNPPAGQPVPSAGNSMERHIIQMTDSGFAPSTLTIRAGKTVEFVNKSSMSHWPASAVHPTHQVCPGFDSLRGLGLNETYSFTFTVTKTCPFHDHLNPTLHGSIIVQ